jgi:hypothetical protein
VLGSHGTIERLSGSTDMVTGRLTSGVHYYPEPANRANGEAISGRAPDGNHMATFLDSVRSRRRPNAPVELGYRTAVAAHMANLAYRARQRITLEDALSPSGR